MVSPACEAMLQDACENFPRAIPALRSYFEREQIDELWRQLEIALEVTGRCVEVQATLDRRQAAARPLSRDEMIERCTWKEGERAEVEREMAERQRRIKRDEVLAWANSRSADTIVTKNTPTRHTHRSESRPAALTTERLLDTIGHVTDAIERVVAIGQEGHTTVTRDLAGLRNQVATLEAELAELRERLDRATPSKSAPLRLLPFDQASMIA